MAQSLNESNPIHAISTVVHEIIQECEPDGIPSGHLYAAFMQYGLSLDAYNYIINNLVREGKIVNKHHLLRVNPSST